MHFAMYRKKGMKCMNKTARNMIVALMVTLGIAIMLCGGCSGGSGGGSAGGYSGDSGGNPGPSPSPSASGTPIRGDYGEAPDGGQTGYPSLFEQNAQFPTFYAHDGARVANVDGAVLGNTISPEIDVNDPADPDGAPNLSQADAPTECDCQKSLFTMLQSIPPPTRMGFTVSVPTGATGGTYYVNILIDLNMNGKWGGVASGGNEPEWVVKNLEIPNLTAGETRRVTTGWFKMTNGNLIPEGAWGRIALTTEKITVTDWTGTGQYTRGEIEDFRTATAVTGKGATLMITFDKEPPIYNGKAAGNGQVWVQNVYTGRESGATFGWQWVHTGTGSVTINPPLNNGNTPCTVGPSNPPGPLNQDWWPAIPPAAGNAFSWTPGQVPDTWEFQLLNIVRSAPKQARGFVTEYFTPTRRTVAFTGDPAGGVWGSVTGDDGEPIEGATIAVGQRSTTSMMGGAYQLIPVPVGDQAITVTAQGFEPHNGTVTVTASALTIYNVTLSRSSIPTGGILKGTVLCNTTHNPLIGAAVTLSNGGGTKTTDAAGQFQFDNIPAGVYTVTATYPNYSPGTASPIIQAGHTTDITIYCTHL
jgi:hypothetical protein